jgi:hypothetical protein
MKRKYRKSDRVRWLPEIFVNIVGENVESCQLATEIDGKGSRKAELKCQNNMVVLGESKKLSKEEK